MLHLVFVVKNLVPSSGAKSSQHKEDFLALMAHWTDGILGSRFPWSTHWPLSTEHIYNGGNSLAAQFQRSFLQPNFKRVGDSKQVGT